VKTAFDLDDQVPVSDVTLFWADTKGRARRAAASGVTGEGGSMAYACCAFNLSTVRGALDACLDCWRASRSRRGGVKSGDGGYFGDIPNWWFMGLSSI